MKLFALVFKSHLPWTRVKSEASCWCMGWRQVRVMLRYYGRDTVKVFRVNGQRPAHFAHCLRKPTPTEIKSYQLRYPEAFK